MDDKELELFFSSLTPQEAEPLLKNIKVPDDNELSNKIKGTLNLKPEGKIKPFTFKRFITLAAAVFAVLICTALGLKVYNETKPVPTTTVPSTTEVQGAFSPELLMAAISNGNDSLIETILSVAPAVFSDEVIKFAVDCVEFISYETLHKIVTAIVDYRGSTGLDKLLECTLLGDSQRALEELEKRENFLMTPLEKLSFFFAVAFCNSEVVDEFIEAGYDITSTDIHGNTLYEIAEKYNNTDNMKYLQTKGV